LVSIRFIDESAHAPSSITNSALFYNLHVTFSHNLGQLRTYSARDCLPDSSRSGALRSTLSIDLGTVVTPLVMQHRAAVTTR
jgi:hypothetical protein